MEKASRVGMIFGLLDAPFLMDSFDIVMKKMDVEGDAQRMKKIRWGFFFFEVISLRDSKYSNI